jgi:hypothetical protein
MQDYSGHLNISKFLSFLSHERLAMAHIEAILIGLLALNFVNFHHH